MEISTLQKSPYFVEPSKKAQQAIKLAVCKGLFTRFEIDRKLVDSYLRSNSLLPIWILKVACNLNRIDIKIPVQYQYLWFCLHGVTLKRTQPSGRSFCSIVNFPPCYIIADNKLRTIVKKACESVNLSQGDLSILSGLKRETLRLYKDKIPITCLLKISQILGLNLWRLLQNYPLLGKTAKEGKIIIPRDDKDIDETIFLIWLKTEGHLELRSAHIEINQKNNIESLRRLRNIILRYFNLSHLKNEFSQGSRGEDRLIISSSPLRQLLCLKYNLPLGYKSGSLERTELKNFSEKEYKRLLATFVITEGCLSHHYTRNKKKKLPRFEFIVKDSSLAQDCIFVMEQLGFKPSFYIRPEQNLFKVGLYDSREVVRLISYVKPYLFNKNKIIHLQENLSK